MKADSKIARNRVLASSLNGTVYFVPKAEDLGGGGYRVIGKKHIVESSLEELLSAVMTKVSAEGVQLRIKVTMPKPKRAAKR